MIINEKGKCVEHRDCVEQSTIVIVVLVFTGQFFPGIVDQESVGKCMVFYYSKSKRNKV